MQFTKIIKTDDEILDALKEANGNVTKAAKLLNVGKTWLFDQLRNRPLIRTTLEAIRNKQLQQKAQDQGRVINKAVRENFRALNAAEEYAQALRSELHNLPTIFTEKYPDIRETRSVGLLHITDVHFNEQVINCGGNSYNWEIAAKRLRVYILNAIRYLDAHKIRNVLLMLGGDLINSNRRLDELTSNATNRAKATLLAVHLLTQAIKELNNAGYNVKIASVTGNESRIDKERGRTEFQATENFDFMIDQILKMRFEKKQGITFIDGDWNAKVIPIAGHNILLIHGDSSIAKADQKSIQALLGKYVTNGEIIRMIFCGHIHAAYVSDLFARGGSMVGNNNFSWDALNLGGRASQNMHIIWENGNVNSIKIDLQEADIEGYQIVPQLEAYNTKSVAKARPQKTILEIRV